MMITERDNKKAVFNSQKKSRSLRRLSMLQKIGFFSTDLKGTKISRAVSTADLENSYKHIYNIYLNNDFIKPNPFKIKIRPYDTSPDSVMFIAKKGKKIVATMGVVPDSKDLGLPSDKAFHKEIDKLRKNNKVCETTSEAIHPDYCRSGILTELIRCVIAHNILIGCTRIIISVNKGHKSFFEFIGFKQIGNVRSYSNKLYDPVILMCWDFKKQLQEWKNLIPEENNINSFLNKFFCTENPYIQNVKLWQTLILKTFNTPLNIINLFKGFPYLFTKSNIIELKAIKKRMGNENFRILQKYYNSNKRDRPNRKPA